MTSPTTLAKQLLEAREFWIDLDDYTEAEIYDETGETISVDAFTARRERPHEDAIHVIEYSAYRDLQRQIAIAGEYARGFKERGDALKAQLLEAVEVLEQIDKIQVTDVPEDIHHIGDKFRWKAREYLKKMKAGEL